MASPWKRPWMVAAILFNIVCSVLLIAYAIFVLRKLSIRLNRINRIKWLIALIAIILRLALSIFELVTHKYNPNALKFYFLYLVD